MGTTTLLIGLGKGGSALMPYLLANPEFDLAAVCDSSREAVGVPMARRMQIPFFDEPIEAVRETSPQLVIDATGDPSLPTLLYEVRPAGTSLVTAEASRLLWVLLAALEGKRRAELRYDRLKGRHACALRSAEGDERHVPARSRSRRRRGRPRASPRCRPPCPSHPLVPGMWTSHDKRPENGC